MHNSYIVIENQGENDIVIYPKFINRNSDTIAVTAPSDGNSSELDYRRLDMAKQRLADLGIKVIETPDVRTSCKGRSSTGAERAEQFMSVWNNPEVSAVISAKGGDFLMEMLPYIDYGRLVSEPKWFQGYSDNTGLAFTITTISDIATVYCNNFNDYAMNPWHKSIANNWDILCGADVCQESYKLYQNGFFDGEKGDEGYHLTEPVAWRRAGYADDDIDLNGRLIGGCMDILLNLVGTRYDRVCDFISKYKSDGILWYMESFSLSSEAIERGLWQLGEAGWFGNVRGFLFGRPAFFSSDTDTSYEEAVMNALDRYNVPVILDADIGHKPPQFTMINGAVCRVVSEGSSYRIRYTYI